MMHGMCFQSMRALALYFIRITSLFLAFFLFVGSLLVVGFDFFGLLLLANSWVQHNASSSPRNESNSSNLRPRSSVKAPACRFILAN